MMRGGSNRANRCIVRGWTACFDSLAGYLVTGFSFWVLLEFLVYFASRTCLKEITSISELWGRITLETQAFILKEILKFSVIERQNQAP